MNSKGRWILIVGDVLVYLLVTIFGFIRHDLFGQTDIIRFLATFIPYSVARFLIAPALGMYDLPELKDYKGYWKIMLAATYAAAVGALLRGLWLNTPVILVFAFVIMDLTIVLMLLWREGFTLIYLKK